MTDTYALPGRAGMSDGVDRLPEKTGELRSGGREQFEVLVALIWPFLQPNHPAHALAPAGSLWQEPARL
jgi:hypothetical protein